MNYQHMSNEELFALLLTEEDRLSREAVNEMVGRGAASVGAMSKIIDTESLWQGERPEWWATIHAVFILGAIGGARACEPLLKALFKADEYDNDWIMNVLPSIVRGLPAEMAEDLKPVIRNEDLDRHLRSCAAGCLAGMTLTHPNMEAAVFRFLGDVFLHDSDETLSDFVGCTLMDFQRREYYDALCERGRNRGGFGVVFDEKDVQRDFAVRSRKLSLYTQDWLEFYAPKSIAARQERWAREEAERKEGKNLGKILDGGMCICSVCGAEKKVGGYDPSVEKPDEGVMCRECMYVDLAERKGISVEAAKKVHEQQLKSTHMMNEICFGKYFAMAGKKAFNSITEANDVLHMVTGAWNALTTEERTRVEGLDDIRMREYFENVEIDFSIVTHVHQYGKPGRNDSCPCGSGKKFKKCCLEKIH